MLIKRFLSLVAIIAGVQLIGCTGFNSFSTAARPGDTVSLTLGWNPELTKDQLTVTITPSSGSPITYIPGDPAIRALVNLYPDPLSRLIVERETGGPADDGWFFGVLMENTVTGADKDFSQKLLIMDLPPGMISGPATVSFASTGGEVIPPLTVEILPGSGARHEFRVQEGLQPMLGEQVDLAERAPHYAVSFSGTELPYAIQVDLTHDPDESTGGTGKPYIVSSRGNDIKSASWADDGSKLRVILMPTGAAIADLVNFKFYVAGGLQNLQLAPSGLKAYDINGGEVFGLVAAITPSP